MMAELFVFLTLALSHYVVFKIGEINGEVKQRVASEDYYNDVLRLVEKENEARPKKHTKKNR